MKGLKDFWFRFKIFIWYLITEPMRQLKQTMHLVFHLISALTKTLTWSYIAMIAMIVSLFMGNRTITAMFLAFFLFAILLWEWETGFFMYRHKQKINHKIKREFELHGTDRNIPGEWDDFYKNERKHREELELIDVEDSELKQQNIEVKK